MGTPTARQSHLDVALTNVSIAYKNAAYIFDQIFPIVPVKKQTDKYFIFDKAAWMRDETAVRAPGTKAARADYTISTSNYLCAERALAKQVPDEVVENSDDPLRPLVTATNYVTDQVLKRMEIDVLGEIFGTSWSGSATPSPVWSDDTADPLGNIETGMFAVAGSIGREPNVGVIGRGLWRYLKNHPDVIDRIRYGGGPGNPAFVTPEAIAALVGLEKLLVARSLYDTALEGATAATTFIGGNHMALLYVTPMAALDTPSAGYVFSWKNREVNRFREEQEHADVVEARASWDVKLTAVDAGYLIKSGA
uniref:Putative capsid protein n=1 Tax=viral metagenome TaxID=1070528 RepID=A0A6M3KKL0_9ZZZZ